MKLGQKSVKNLVGFLGDLKRTPIIHSEINWPLVQKKENDTREEIQSRGQYLALLHDLPRLKFAWKKKKWENTAVCMSDP